MATTIKIYKTDTAPNVTFTITRTDGTVVNLTGCTIRLKIQDPVTGALTNTNLNNTCTIVSAVNGICTYAWSSTDLPDPGTYSANLVITYPTNDRGGTTPQKETFGISIQVTDTV